ncbi:MAG: hypothetical protein AB2697_21855 [Candidatus Thiodiazotropha endolucinida]
MDDETIFGFVILSILAGIGVLIYDIYSYLKSGNWDSIDTIDLLREMKADWAFNPTDWIGLWEVLNAIPLFIILIILPILLAYIVLRFTD